MVVFVLPAGLGAREGILLVVLGHDLPTAEVATVVALSRVIVTVSDLSSALLATGYWLLRGRRVGAANDSGTATGYTREYAAASRVTAS